MKTTFKKFIETISNLGQVTDAKSVAEELFNVRFEDGKLHKFLRVNLFWAIVRVTYNGRYLVCYQYDNTMDAPKVAGFDTFEEAYNWYNNISEKH